MEVFDSLMDAGLSIGLTQKEMYRCCNSKNNQLGKDKKCNPIKWMYYDEYLNSAKEVIKGIENSIHYSNREVICITTGEIFKNSVGASKKYDLEDRNIRRCCYGKGNYCGKLSDDTELKWIFLSVWEKMSQDERDEKVNEKRK